MPRKGKKFIDKKKDKIYTFKVVSRSQQDPLIADETAPQSVLVDTSKETKKTAIDYGVFFDDDYDYLQHLRGVKEAIDWEDCDLEVYTLRKPEKKKKDQNVGLVLPSSAFESFVEEPVGMLNKAAPVYGPQLDIDPDIVAEFDRLECEGEACNEEIPDDFFQLMNSEEPLEDDKLEVEKSHIEKWFDYDGGYDSISNLESYDKDELDTQQDVIIEEINKKSGLSVLSEYDTESEEDDEVITDDEFNVSDEEEINPKNVSIHNYNYLKNYTNSMNTESELVRIPTIEEAYPENDYDPLGYGGNLQISDDESSKDLVTSMKSLKIKTKPHDIKSQTSRTSHSCSHLPRTELMSWLDDRFEYFYENEYSEDQWGALDDRIIEGHLNTDSEVFRQILEKTKKQIERQKRGTEFDESDKDRIVQWIKEGQMLGKDYEKEEFETKEFIKSSKPKYDCESVLSFSVDNTNKPAILDLPQRQPRIEIDCRRGYPLLHQKSQLTKKALVKHDQDNRDDDVPEFETETLKSRLSLVSYRPPNETSEDRRDRKKAVKELRRERRIEKKINKEAFKEEKKRQIKININNKNNNKIPIV